MANVADRARFYLERMVPQLREWEEHGIFTPDEIRAIVRRRSEFEHRILSPGSRASQFSAYSAYERAVAALLDRRLKRMHVHNLPSRYLFSARVAAILERGVDRHPTSGELWREYLDECAQAGPAGGGNKKTKNGSTKRWRRGMTRALRLLPTDAGLWVMAGRQAVADGDWARARGMFMRACRFCVGPGGESVWLEFARCEMLWLERMERKTRGAGGGRQGVASVAREDGDGTEILFGDDDDDDGNDGGDDGDGRFILPEPGASSSDSALDIEIPTTTADADADADNKNSTAAMSGAIPRSIFDAATKQAFFSPVVALAFFRLFASFRPTAIPASTTDSLVRHVADAVAGRYRLDARAALCEVTQPVVGLDPRSVEFIRGLREMLVRLRGHDIWERETGGAATGAREELARLVGQEVDGWLKAGGGGGALDAGVVAVLEDVKCRMAERVGGG